jgi:hypothetical protein
VRSDGGTIVYTLGCIQEIRQKLDRNELSTVKQARQVGMSWTEIATPVGVSRQVAWERWHEVDADVAEQAGVVGGRRAYRRTVASSRRIEPPRPR